MSNCLLYLTMTARTQCSKVIKFIRHIYNEVVAPPVDMVNMQGAPIFALWSLAPSTNLVTLKNKLPDLLPASTMFKPCAPSVARMIYSNLVHSVAFFRTELTTFLYPTGKEHERLVTMQANVFLLSDNPLVSTGFRAVVNSIASWLELLPTYQAGCYSCIGFYPLHLAFMRTKAVFSISLDNVVRTLKLFSTICTYISLGSHLRGKLAGSTAILSSRIVSLKFFLALEAYLEHC